MTLVKILGSFLFAISRYAAMKKLFDKRALNSFG